MSVFYVKNHVFSVISLRKNTCVQISVCGTDFLLYRFLLPPSPQIFRQQSQDHTINFVRPYRFLHAILGVRFPAAAYEQNLRSLSVECGSRSDSVKRICGTNPWKNYVEQICETNMRNSHAEQIREMTMQTKYAKQTSKIHLRGKSAG